MSVDPGSAGSVLVAGCGNPQAGDDAFGPLVTGRLRQVQLPGATVVDLDIKPTALLDHLPGPSGLILIDAVRAEGLAPGELVDIDWFAAGRPALVNDDALSSHGLGLADQLRLAETLDLLPAWVHLVAAPVESVELGANHRQALTDLVDAAARRIVDRVEAAQSNAA